MTKELNLYAVKAMAIATAYYQRDWIPGTLMEEAFHDFKELRRQAEENLQWAGIEDKVSDYDIAEALWNMEEDDYIEFMMNMDEENGVTL
jgi:hypothetical protein